MNNISERDAFEAALKRGVFDVDCVSDYSNCETEAAWRGWQARAASTSANVAQGAEVTEVGFVVDCSQSIDDVLPADRRWTIANAIGMVAEYRNCPSGETKEVMQRFATYMRAALADAATPAQTANVAQGAEEPDCWAILTPNGSRLVSPDEAKGRLDAYPLYTAPTAQTALRRIAHELRTYNPAADEYKGEHIHKVWAREIEAILPAASNGESK